MEENRKLTTETIFERKEAERLTSCVVLALGLWDGEKLLFNRELMPPLPGLELV